MENSHELPKSLEDLNLSKENLYIGTQIGAIVHMSIREAEKSIKIVSPYIGRSEVDLLRDKKLGGLDDITVVTRITDEIQKSDEQIEALKKVIIQKKQKNVDEYSYKPIFQAVFFDGYSLHEKIYLIDDDVAYLGSFNFTYSGMHTNHETCLIIRDTDIIKELNGYFSSLLTATSKKWDITELGKLLYEKRPAGVIQNSLPDENTNTGYCIKCKSPIAYDKENLFCHECRDNTESDIYFCHRCGEKYFSAISPKKP